ncbi:MULTISPECIES: hypothetical protein [unclassified Bradyrhizobium]|uniref:hypothetical protein n=1 Tax=unclassified Bradyrhizobium TaxID=2631580 RepID=UPI0028E2B242|nr:MULTISPECIES: hypothetical protein [unclassified Bradyrhizobium]
MKVVTEGQAHFQTQSSAIKAAIGRRFWRSTEEKANSVDHRGDQSSCKNLYDSGRIVFQGDGGNKWQK